jgi:hypothetical protein
MKRDTVDRIETYSFEIVIVGSVAAMLILSVAGLLAFSMKFALGVIVGGVVVVLNHIGLYRSLRGLLSAVYKRVISETGEEEEKPVGGGGVFFTVFGFYLRMILSGVIIYLALKGGWVMPIALFVGASVVVLNSFIVAMLLYKVD